MPALNRRQLAAVAFGLALVAALALPYLHPHPAPRYTVTDLGVLPGDTVSGASGINNHGDIVGVSSKDDATTRIFLVHQSRMTSLGSVLFLGSGSGPDINDNGKINLKQRLSSYTVLSAYEKHHAILYSGSRKVDFAMPLGWKSATVRGINTSGQLIVMCYRHAAGNRPSRAAFVYDSHTHKFSLLPLPPGFQGAGFAMGINDHGQIVGSLWQAGILTQAVLWNTGQPVRLTGLPGMDDSSADGINNSGEMVGSAWSGLNAAAQYVNDHPQRWRLLVPLFQKQWKNRAVVFQDNKAQDLNSLIPEDAGWTLEEASGINDRGQIVGYGLHNGQERAFLMTPR